MPTLENFKKIVSDILGEIADVSCKGPHYKPLYQGEILMGEYSVFYKFKVIYRVNQNNAQVVIMIAHRYKLNIKLKGEIDTQFTHEFGTTNYKMIEVDDVHTGQNHLVIEIESIQDPNLAAFITKTYQAVKNFDAFYVRDDLEDDLEDDAPAVAAAPVAKTNYKVFVAGKQVESFATMTGGAKASEPIKPATAAAVAPAPIIEIKNPIDVFKNNIAAGKNKVQAAKDAAKKAVDAVAAAEKALVDAKAAQAIAEKNAATADTEFGNMSATFKAQLEAIAALLSAEFGAPAAAAADPAPAADPAATAAPGVGSWSGESAVSA
jgi:hypothetical protein